MHDFCGLLWIIWSFISLKKRFLRPWRWLFQLADDSVFCYLEDLSWFSTLVSTAGTSLELGDEWDLELPFYFPLGKSRSPHSQEQVLLETNKQELPSQRSISAFWETFQGFPRGPKHPIQKLPFPGGSLLWCWVRHAAPTSASRQSSVHACTHVYVLAVLTPRPFKKRPCG